MQHQSSYSQQDLQDIFDVPDPPEMQLPSAPMRMVDRIPQVTSDGGRFGKGSVTAELDIDPDLWFFACHFRGDPVMPGCLGLDALWQMLGFFLAWSGHHGRGRALGVGEVKFFGEILPHNKVVTYQVDVKRVLTKAIVLGIADGDVHVDGQHIYSARNLKVGLIQGPSLATEAAS
jgi:3-hydroxyacyl-[acyl-carrier protein] dehydratase/trans-2-decenoyl-[acyl-carrier protein] isomerase